MTADPELTADAIEARMRALAARVTEREERGRCPVCAHRFPPAPAPAICSHCEIAAALPVWGEWPPVLRVWLVRQLVARRMQGYRVKQEPWEQLLRGAFVSSTPSPDGRLWPLATAAAELFPVALHLSTDWIGSEDYRRFLTFLLGDTPTDADSPDRDPRPAAPSDAR